MKRSIQIEAFLDDRHQHVDRDSGPDLGFDGVLGGAEETLDAQVLLDPLEEQLHLPAAFVERGNGERRQSEVVGEKYKTLAGLVAIADAAQMLRVMRFGVEAVQSDRLIADHSSAALGGRRVEPPSVQVGFCPDDEEGARLIEDIEALEIEIAAIHDIEGAGLGQEQIEHVDLVQFPIRNMDEAGNCSAQVEQRVQLQRRLGRTEICPREYRQTQVDGGGIQGIDCVGELHAERVVGVELSRLRNERLGKLGMNAPVACFVGIGQRGTGNWRAKPHVIELGRLRREARFDIAQTLSVSELRKGHAAKLLGATQGARPMIAAIASDDAMKSFPRQKVHHLREQRLAKVHSPLRPKQGRRSVTGELARSNRRHLDSS
jgi:hypothetical protein